MYFPPTKTELNKLNYIFLEKTNDKNLRHGHLVINFNNVPHHQEAITIKG